MRVLTAKVVDGRLDIAQDKLPDGTTVTLLVPEADHAGFTLTDKERTELTEAIRQADQGETVDGWQLLADLGP